VKELGFAQLLAEQREHIVARFVDAVQRKDLSPPGVSRPLLVDHIPKFLDEIAREFQRRDSVRFSQDAVDTSETARQHGVQRWSVGYDLEAVIREYGILRHAILQTIKEAGLSLSVDEFDVLAKCLSVGVAEAVTEYVKFRDRELHRQKDNLEFLAQAGQRLSASLDYRTTLGELTRVLVPKLADWCAVHIEGNAPEDIPVAHVDPAKVDVVREIYRRFPLPPDAAYGYPHVMRTGQPQWMRDLPPTFLEDHARDPEHLALLRAVAARSWMIVPLRIQGNVVGALTLAYSDSQRRYEESDLVLAMDLAQRAAVAIDNARLYEQSQQARSRVEAATRAKDEFVAMVSHELRTPLNALLGWLRLLRSGSLPEEKREHALHVIERNAKAQNQLVADLLDASRVIAGKLRVTPVPQDLAPLVEMAVEGVRPAAEAKGITVATSIERENTVTRADAERLQQAVWNLLTNAVKFTPKGGHVTVRLQRVASDIELTVSDDGEGIPASFLPHVFESFSQQDTSASRRHSGLGIGLPIAKHIVELHGGSIDARSDGAGAGATFVLRLPVAPLLSTSSAGSHVPATTDETRSDAARPDLSGLRVLVVDDDADARELLTFVLESCGCVVFACPDVTSAVATLRREPLDVIVSDIGMPGEDGYALIRSVRTLPDEAKRSTPAIALTAFARNEDRTRALVEGFNQHMAKPVEPAVLLRVVADLAGRRVPSP
jgi:signal transduction histidine kinase/ActR/RegA family two-component response regulator